MSVPGNNILQQLGIKIAKQIVLRREEEEEAAAQQRDAMKWKDGDDMTRQAGRSCGNFLQYCKLEKFLSHCVALGGGGGNDNNNDFRQDEQCN